VVARLAMLERRAAGVGPLALAAGSGALSRR
jgi:hypothetical protein